jgi:hypothetical protein
MAKKKTIKKVTKAKKVGTVRKIASTKVDNKLSILLIVLALLIFALAALSMSVQSVSKTVSPSPVPVKVTVTPSAKPIVKTVKTAK